MLKLIDKSQSPSGSDAPNQPWSFMEWGRRLLRGSYLFWIGGMLGTLLYGWGLASATAQDALTETSGGGLGNANSLDAEEEKAFLDAGNVAQASVVQIEVFGVHDASSGQNVAPGPFSGTILAPDGWIATSNHFFQTQPASITVILANGDRKPGKLVARDHSREIALIKISSDEPLQSLVPSDSKEWQVGQWTIALGKSFDPAISSRSVGILSATGRVWDKAIQTDCKISPQNYGGPLIDLYGNCMGILTTLNPGIVTEGEVEQWYDSGIGFAIPIDDILERLPRLQSGEDIYPGQAGFAIRGKDEFQVGIVVDGVSPGSPAFKSGLLAGDKILRAGRTPEVLQDVSTYSSLKHVIGPIDATQSFVLEIQRGEERSALQMEMVKDLPKYQEPYLGVVIAKQSDGSELVLQIADESPAAKFGLNPGERIVGVNSQKLTELVTLPSLLPFLDYREPLSIDVADVGGAERQVVVDLTARPNGDVTMGPVVVEQGASPEGEGSTDDQSTVPKGVVQIPLGDIKNKAFAIVPNQYTSEVPHGLLVIYAEPGPNDSKIWIDLWEKFCEDNRWICAVVQSADETRWTFEEIEVGQRVRTYLAANYQVDERRTCVAGFGAGGLMALVTSAQFENDFQALWLSDAKIPNRIRLTPASPEDNRRCFLNGRDPELEKIAKLFDEAGYNYNYSPEELGSFQKPDAAKLQDRPVFDRAKRWLRHLEVL